MDIHKPKSARNLREFAIEILTIVLGVVIAICLEQFVEYLHWHREVGIARKSLTAEIAVIDNFYALRIAVATCSDRQLDQAQKLISDVAANRKLGPVTISGLGLGALLSDSEWQSERASQILTHFPRGELALMSSFYAQVTDFHDWVAKEGEAWAGLTVLRDAADGLGPADLAQLRLNLHAARRTERLILLNARRELAISDKLGIKYPPPSRAQIEGRCNPPAGQGNL